MNFFSTTLFKIYPKPKKYDKVYVLMTGPSINSIEIKKINKCLKNGKCAVFSCNSFFLKDVGLNDSSHIYYMNADPLQIEFFKNIYYSKNHFLSFRSFIKSKDFDKYSINGLKQNLRSIQKFKTFFPNARIVDFFTSKKTKNNFLSKNHYIAYPKITNYLFFNFILRFVMAHHLSGWKKYRYWNFIKSKGNFKKNTTFSKLKYLTFLATRHNSFYYMMDLAAHFGAKEIIIAGKSCQISKNLTYINKIPFLNYQYFYNHKKQLIKYLGMNPDLILDYMINLRNYLSSFEDYHSVKIKTYSNDIWAIDRNI
jgi:hypothetical protein